MFDNSTGAGTLQFRLSWNLPSPPAIVCQWAALVPLVIHLASVKGDHNLVGELALTGKLTLSLFPKLGHLLGIARLFSENPDYLTQASSKSDLSATVWDVGWGSSFRCANGAARDYLTRFALRNCGPLIDLESEGEDKLSRPQPRKSSKVVSEDEDKAPDIPQSRRYQTLYVVELKKIKKGSGTSLQAWHHYFRLIYSVALSILTVLLVLCSAFGTAATVLLCVVTQIVCVYVPVSRPTGYMGNTEHQKSAYMLCAIHENASTWYLYVGDRPSIDWLLNKTMIKIISKHRTASRLYFRGAHYFQLLAMTYVAAQTGWDGIFLMCLLMLNAVFKLITGFPAHQAASKWISDSSLEVRAHSFLITGRVPMLGAIHLLGSESGPSDGQSRPEHLRMDWMDDILHPTVRRKVWADNLANLPGQPVAGEETLSKYDQNWLVDNLSWSNAFYQRIKHELAQGSTKPRSDCG